MRTALLVLLFGVLYLVGLGSYGLIDRDEAAYAEVTREMLARGDLLVPHYNGEEIFDKPPLLYWVQAVGFRVFGEGPLGARIGNALAALATVLGLFAFARRPLGERAAFLSALVLGSALMFVILARMTLMDMLLLLALVVSLGSLHRAIGRAPAGPAAGAGWFAVASAAAGVGMLAKGAIGLALPAAAGGVWLLVVGEWRRVLRPAWLLPGVLLALGVGTTWYLLIGLTQPGGFGFMQELFVENHWHRLRQPMQGHGGPFFYYVPVVLLGFLPWSAFLPLALARGGWRPVRHEPGRFVALFGLLSLVSFLLFSAAATKLPHYALPVFPGAALLVGHLLSRDAREVGFGDRAWAWTFAGTGALLLAAAGALLALPWLVARLPGWLGDDVETMPGLLHPFSAGAVPALGAAVAVAGAAALGWAWRRRQPRAAANGLAATALALWALLILAGLPRFDAHYLASLERLSRAAGRLTTADEPVLLLDLRHRPSVQFYSQRRTSYVRLSDGGPRLFGGPDPHIVITTDLVLPRLEGRGPFEVLERDRGYVLLRSLPARDGDA